MKYGILFAIVAVLLVMLAITNGGWFLLLLWPALSFGIVSLGYLCLGTRVYGKSANGRLATINQLLLLPYLGYLSSVWYILRFVKREPAFHQLATNLFIGRRLLAYEFPDNIDHVIDLTCEFHNPNYSHTTSYHSFQILDAFVPSDKQLCQWVSEVAELSGNIYIHCAEGHGRTGLFAAALLLQSGHSLSPEEALAFIKSKRPLVRLGRLQLELLHTMQEVFDS